MYEIIRMYKCTFSFYIPDKTLRHNIINVSCHWNDSDSTRYRVSINSAIRQKLQLSRRGTRGFCYRLISMAVTSFVQYQQNWHFYREFLPTGGPNFFSYIRSCYSFFKEWNEKGFFLRTKIGWTIDNGLSAPPVTLKLSAWVLTIPV